MVRHRPVYRLYHAAAIAKTFLVVEQALIALSPIRLKHEVSWPATSGIYQKFYRLAGTSEFLLVDLAVMTWSAPDKFLNAGDPRRRRVLVQQRGHGPRSSSRRRRVCSRAPHTPPTPR